MSSPASEDAPEKPAKRRRVSLAVLAGIATVLGTLLTGATFYMDHLNPKPGGSPGAFDSPAPPSQQPAQGSVRSEEAPSFAIGQCLDEAWSVTACDRLHTAELVSTDGPCDSSALVKYAGGIPFRDTMRRDLALRTIDSVGCVVMTPTQLTFKVQDGLLSSDSASLRQCWDQLSQRDKNCGQPHTAEVVYSTSALGTAETDCRQRAETYTGGAFSRYEAKLEVLREESSAGVSCLVQIKGNNNLSGSIKNLATKALPISPRD